MPGVGVKPMHHQNGVDYAGNPENECEHQIQQACEGTAATEHGKGWKHDGEEISHGKKGDKINPDKGQSITRRLPPAGPAEELVRSR
jgi:hypothetical protein